MLKYINNRRGLTVQDLQKALREDNARKIKSRIRQSPLNRAQGRSILDSNNPIDWDEDPTIYQATSIAHGHILQFKQEWVNNGYSLGDLLYSLPLAPGQKKQIVTLDWERREAASRIEDLDYQESLQNSLSRDRDINDLVNGIVSENQNGGSKSSTRSKSSSGGGGGGFGLSLGFFSIGGGGGGSTSSGSSSASSSAWQQASRQSSLSSLQQLRDKTKQSASSVRNQRSTVIQTASQGERFSVETEVVANYNHCHAITIQYFEVLRHFQIQHRLANVQECLFIPLDIGLFDGKKTLRWREVLAENLLEDTISRRPGDRIYIRGRRNPLLRGFDAIERRENDYEGSDLPIGIYADENITYIDGSLNLRFQITRPLDRIDEDGEASFSSEQWAFLQRLIPHKTADQIHERFLKGQERKDEIFLREIAPDIAENFVQHLKFEAIASDGKTVVDIDIDATLTSRFINDRNLQVSLRMGPTPPNGLRRSDIRFIRIRTDFIGDGGSFIPPSQLLPPNSRVLISSGFMAYRTENLSSYLFRNSRIQNDLTGSDSVQIFTPLNRTEERNPRMQDEELANSLIDHLNDNLEYYHNVIWVNMNPRRRFMFLDGIQVVDFSEVDTYPQGIIRSVASVVENRIIGIEGNCLIMPVAPGFRLNPNIRGKDVDLLDFV